MQPTGARIRRPRTSTRCRDSHTPAAGGAGYVDTAGRQPVKTIRDQSHTVRPAPGDGDCTGHSRRQTCLAARIQSPRHHRPVIADRQTVTRTGGDIHHAAQPAGHRRLTVRVQAPPHHRPITLQRQTMIPARRDVSHPGQPGRHRRLTARIQPPRHHHSIALQRQTMTPTGGNDDHSAQSRRHRRLPIRIQPPRHHRSIALQRQTMTPTTSNRDDLAQPCRHRRLPVHVQAPRHHRPIALQCQTMIPTGRNRDHATQSRRHRRLTARVQPPRHHRPIALQRQTMTRARLNCQNAGHAGRRCCLIAVIQTPRDDRRRIERRGSVAGDVRVSRIAGRIVSAGAIVVSRVRHQAGIPIARGVREQLRDLIPWATRRVGPLDLDADLVVIGIRPRQPQAARVNRACFHVARAAQPNQGQQCHRETKRVAARTKANAAGTFA